MKNIQKYIKKTKSVHVLINEKLVEAVKDQAKLDGITVTSIVEAGFKSYLVEADTAVREQRRKRLSAKGK